MKNLLTFLLLSIASTAFLSAQNAPLRVFANGNTGLNSDTAHQKLQINGAIKIGATATLTPALLPGSIQWTNSDFQGYTGSGWVSLTSDGDDDDTNELQNWGNLPGIPADIDIDATDDFSGSWNDLTSVPADIADGDDVNDADADSTNELQNWSNLPGIPADIDIDATDDFSGSWNDLTSVPADIADGDDVDDADADPSNELQNWSNLPGIPADIDIDATDDFSGSWNDLTGVPADIADGDDVDDADADPTNELQSLSVVEDTLYLTSGGSVTLPQGSLWDNGDATSIVTPERVGIGVTDPSVALEVNGDVVVSGELSSMSDGRLKMDIRNIQNASVIMSQLRAVLYQFDQSKLGSDLPDGERMGLIAQELEKVLPELVHQQDSGLKTVNYLELIPLLIASHQELAASKDALETKVDQLSKDVEELKALIKSQQE